MHAVTSSLIYSGTNDYGSAEFSKGINGIRQNDIIQSSIGMITGDMST